MLYAEIDRNKMFRGTVTDKADRSYMNICFVMNDEYKDLEADFLKFATEKGMVGIKGTPFCRRFPCILLQRYAEGKRSGFD